MAFGGFPIYCLCSAVLSMKYIPNMPLVSEKKTQIIDYRYTTVRLSIEEASIIHVHRKRLVVYLETLANDADRVWQGPILHFYSNFHRYTAVRLCGIKRLGS